MIVNNSFFSENAFVALVFSSSEGDNDDFLKAEVEKERDMRPSSHCFVVCYGVQFYVRNAALGESCCLFRCLWTSIGAFARPGEHSE